MKLIATYVFICFIYIKRFYAIAHWKTVKLFYHSYIVYIIIIYIIRTLANYIPMHTMQKFDKENFDK